MTPVKRMLRSVLIVWAATAAGCRPPLRHLTPGLLAQLSPDLGPGAVAGVVVDSASRAALGYAQILLWSDSTPGSPPVVTTAGHADADGHFALSARMAGPYTLQVRHVGHRSLRAPLQVPESGGVFVTVTLAADSVACATWPDLCQ